MMTPRMSHHARARCAEMGISTKVAKRIVQHADVTHCTSSRGRDKPRYVATARAYPDYAVPYFVDPEDGCAVVLTVLFNTDEQFVRKGATFELAGANA